MPLTPLLPGDPEKVGDHRLLGRLGQGGMGTVFLGLDATERAVAVKVLREGPADLEGRRRFRRELELLQRVRGQHLVEVLGGDVEADPPWIVTRFVPGQRLDDHVDRHGPLDESALRRLADGMAEGLHTLHRAGVVHRDLSPGNVLLVDGEPQVIDLGLAILADVTSHTRTGLLLGTAGYLAPEQVVGETAGPASDVHAWGAVVAFAGTGRPPYGTGRPDAVLYRVVHAEPDLDGLPADLHALVAEAMSKDPQARPAPTLLGRRLAELAPPRAVAPDRPEPGHDVTALLGPRATEVLGHAATQILDGELVVDLDAVPPPSQQSPPVRQRTTVLAAQPAAAPHATAAPYSTAAPHSTRVLSPQRTYPPDPPPAAAADTELLPVTGHPRPRDHTRVLPTAPPSWQPAPSGFTGDGSEPAAPWSSEAESGDPAEPEPRRSALQAWWLAVCALLLAAACARWAPWLTAAVSLTGLLLVQVAARSRQAYALRRDRRGPRGGDVALAALKVPGQTLMAALDLAASLPLGLAVAVPVTWLVADGLPFGRSWLPDQAEPSEGRATAVACGLLVLLVVVLRPRRWRGARLMLRRAATTPTPPAALFLGVALLVLGLSVLAYAGTTDVVWTPFQGAPFR